MFTLKLQIITPILVPYQPHSSRPYFCWALYLHSPPAFVRLHVEHPQHSISEKKSTENLKNPSHHRFVNSMGLSAVGSLGRERAELDSLYTVFPPPRQNRLFTVFLLFRAPLTPQLTHRTPGPDPHSEGRPGRFLCMTKVSCPPPDHRVPIKSLPIHTPGLLLATS